MFGARSTPRLRYTINVRDDRPPSKPAARRAQSNSAVASAAGLERRPGPVTPSTRLRSPLALVAREQSLYCAGPAGQFSLACGLAHVGFEAVLEPPIVGESGGLGVDAGGEAGEIGGAERGGFLDHRAVDRRIEQIGEALHGPV